MIEFFQRCSYKIKYVSIKDFKVTRNMIDDGENIIKLPNVDDRLSFTYNSFIQIYSCY